MKPKITLIKQKSSAGLQAHLDGINSLTVFVGIPSSNSSAQRREVLRKKESKFTSARKRNQRKKQVVHESIQKDVSDAMLLYWFSKGTFQQPGRPVIEPALRAPGTREKIAEGFAEAMALTMSGKNYEAKKRLQKVATLGKNASKAWFTDPQNGWPGNAQRTIQHKGFDAPGIATKSMYDAIQGWVE